MVLGFFFWFVFASCFLNKSKENIIYVDDLGDEDIGNGSKRNPFRQISDAVESASSGDRIFIKEGLYVFVPTNSIDQTCGNCDDSTFRADIAITVGLSISNKNLHIEGESREDTIIDTGSGYGLYFQQAGQSSLTNLTITGGKRDADGRATDAAVVVKYTELQIENVDIVSNNDLYQGEPDPVVGVMGIAGREGAKLTVVGSRILNSSWDGLTLYRGDPEVSNSAPSLVAINNEIGCSENCIYEANGRGVGIGITWDATAEIINNRVYGYWKGIGSFGDTQVLVANNIVEDMHGWGIIASGSSEMEAVNNVVARCGNVGMAGWDSGAKGRFVNNIVFENGNVDEWVGKQVGVWMNSENIALLYNNIWNNNGQNVCSGGYPAGAACEAQSFDGIDGNMSLDPGLIEQVTYQLSEGSPMIDAGAPDIFDIDGSLSDLGIYGGPHSGREE